MKILLAFLVTILLSACGQAPQIDSRVKPTYNQFMRDCARWGAKCQTEGLTVELVPVMPKGAAMGAIGVCIREVGKFTNKRNVYIYDNLDNVTQETTLYHELSHCTLNAPHVDGAPDIMNTDTTYSAEIEANFQAFVKQMFTRLK